MVQEPEVGVRALKEPDERQEKWLSPYKLVKDSKMEVAGVDVPVGLHSPA